MEFLQLISQTSVMVWLREGGSIWGYPTVLFMHTVSLGTVAGVSGAIDLRVLGFGRRIPIPALLPLFRLMWWALAVATFSGLVLLFTDPTTKLSTPIFYVKLLFVAAGVVFVRRQQRDLAAPASDTPATTGSSGRMWAIASLLAWVGAITAGRLIAYMGPIEGLG